MAVKACLAGVFVLALGIEGLPSAGSLPAFGPSYSVSTQSAVRGLKRISVIRALRGGEEKKGTDGAGEVKWTPSAAAELHDNINIVVLSGLGAASVWALYSGNMDIIKWVTWVGFVYIALDSAWLTFQPTIVKSPSMILAHHVATLLVLLDPLLQPSHSVYTSACLLVEINTVLLLLRRKFSYSNLVEVPFLISWVLLRNIWYPLLLVYFLFCALPTTFGPILPKVLSDVRSQIEGPSPSNMLLVSMLSWAGVCFFQFVWTRQLFATHPWFGGRKKAAADSKEKKYL